MFQTGVNTGRRPTYSKGMIITAYFDWHLLKKCYQRVKIGLEDLVVLRDEKCQVCVPQICEQVVVVPETFNMLE